MNKIFKKIISGTVICTMLTYTMPIFAYTNKETIYSNLNTSGNVYQSIASTITENEKGTKTNKENIEKELPIDCKIIYTLNGKTISPEKIVGKSGEVKITLEYTNKEKNEINVNGKKENVYTPFLVISGVILNNENNKNIEISNGKLINNGDKTIAIGYALPGMDENLDLDINIPNKIEISMTSTNFEIGNIMSFATPKVLKKGNLDNIYDELDKIYSQVDNLESASKEIENGSITLRDGISTLNNGSKDLNNGSLDLKNGIDTLKNGTEALNTGANTLKTGIKEYASNSNILNENMKKMSNGTNDLNKNYSQIDAGIKNIEQQLPTLKTGTSNLYGALSNQNGILENMKQLNNGLAQVTTLASNNNDTISYIENAINTINTKQNTTITDNSEELSKKKADIQSQIDKLNTTLEALKNTNPHPTSEIQSTIDCISSSIKTLEESKNLLVPVNSNIQNIDLSDVENNLTNAKTSLEKKQTITNSSLQNLINGYSNITSAIETQIVPGSKQLDDGVNALLTGITTISGGSTAIKNGITTINSSANQLSEANNKLNIAVTTISKGATDLAIGTSNLNEGTTKLAQGSQILVDGISTLSNGTDTLLDGGNKLVEGIKKFNTDGIEKICNLVNENVRKIENKFKVMEDLSEKYQTFATNDIRDDINFISITDSLKKDKKNEK